MAVVRARAIRAVFAGSLAVALQVGALTAPLVHAHPGDQHDGHHRTQVVHTHVGGHAHSHSSPVRSSTAIHSEESPEHVTALQQFVAVERSAMTQPALAPASFALQPLVGSTMRRAPREVHSHGPPALSSVASRAPPPSV